MEKLPFVSVIVLNYFGEKVIGGVLGTLEKLDYPKDSYEVLVVDNGSTDKSIGILNNWKEKSENNRLILNNKNLGFSKGNNVGIKNSKGDYVVLLNNDCIVERDWLSELIKTALNHPKVFAVNSKILLYPQYINLEFTVDSYLIPQYSWLAKSKIYDFNEKKIYLNLQKKEIGFHTEIPFDPENDKEMEIHFVFNCGTEINTKNLKTLIQFKQDSAQIIESTAAKNEVSYKIRINLKEKEIMRQAFSKIQNAGIMPFQDGYARDIGGIVKDSRQYYEHDKGQYDKEVEIYAACGAAMLINRKMLEETGYLDETFFMYYEDVEISESARLRGYNIYYSPKAIVRHLHALSSGEGSDFFVYNVEKGRLLHVFYNFPIKVFFNEYIKMVLLVCYGFAKAIFHLRHLRSFSKKPGQEKPSYKLKLQKMYVLAYFITRLPWLLYLKHQKHKSLAKDAVSKNYNEILSGRWYFE